VTHFEFTSADMTEVVQTFLPAYRQRYRLTPNRPVFAKALYSVRLKILVVNTDYAQPVVMNNGFITVAAIAIVHAVNKRLLSNGKTNSWKHCFLFAITIWFLLCLTS